MRELDPNHPGLNPNHPPQWRAAKKLSRKTNSQTVDVFVTAKYRFFWWYRRSVPNRSTTSQCSPPRRVVGGRERHLRHNDLDTKMPTIQQFITGGHENSLSRNNEGPTFQRTIKQLPYEVQTDENTLSREAKRTSVTRN